MISSYLVQSAISLLLLFWRLSDSDASNISDVYLESTVLRKKAAAAVRIMVAPEGTSSS